MIKKSGDGSRNKLVWKWVRGEAVELSDFGDPASGTTDYEVCLYEDLSGVPLLIMAAAAPAGGLCANGKPCWKATSGGFRYRDINLTPDGVQKLVLKEGGAGKSRVLLRAKGADLSVPGMPFSQNPLVTVQLVNSAGACWQAQYSSPPSKNLSDEFKDKND